MKSKLVIVTDLGRLKAFRLDLTSKQNSRLEPLKEVVFEEAHRRLVDMVTDLSGRHAAPTRKQWGSPMADSHNLELEIRRRLIRRIARQIERLIQQESCDGCWLAAEKEIDHQILEELPQNIRKRIEKNLPHDLTKATQKELLERFRSS